MQLLAHLRAASGPAPWPHDVEHAGNDRLRLGVADLGRTSDRTRREARAAFRARVEHVVDAGREGNLECHSAHRVRAALPKALIVM